MLFPLQSYALKPYFGMGVTLSHIAQATPQGTYRNATQQNLVLNTIEAFRSTATPVFIGGFQLKVPLASFYSQVTASPANNNFFLFTGSNWRASLEAGLRVNAGSSVDRVR